jgi:hypothetical protein
MSRTARSLIWFFQRRPDLIRATWTALCDYSLDTGELAGPFSMGNSARGS